MTALKWLLLRWLLTLSKSRNVGYFANPEQVKKQPYNKTSLGETGCLSIFGPPPRVTGTPSWLLRPMKFSTSSELYLNMRLYFLFGMLRHSVFFRTCDLRDAMPRQWSITLLPREAEDFPRGGNHSKHMLLFTYLVWLQPVYHNPRFVFIHVNTVKVLLLVKTLIKNIEKQPH